MVFRQGVFIEEHSGDIISEVSLVRFSFLGLFGGTQSRELVSLIIEGVDLEAISFLLLLRSQLMEQNALIGACEFLAAFVLLFELLLYLFLLIKQHL